MSFSNRLLDWYKSFKRDLPWRNSKDPYLIWICEVILQQTKILQGLSYYENFIKKFPTLELLASAKEEEVLKAWEGLGYYSRARNLHFSAKEIWEKRKGVFPNSSKELLKLKGIGPYSSAAIASICFNEVIPAIDGNVYRVLSRYFGIYLPINTPEAQKKFSSLALNLIDLDVPGDFNQALMELGALICLPKKAKCYLCPISQDCFALKNKAIENLPLKVKKKELKKRFFYYLFLKSNKRIALRKRNTQDVWKGLYEFPLIESTNKLSQKELKKSFLEKFSLSANLIEKSIYKLSHQEIYIEFWESLHINSYDIKEEGFNWIVEIKNYPFAKPICVFLKNKSLI